MTVKSEFYIKINDNFVPLHLLSDTELKHYNYLCKYLKMIINRVVINVIKCPNYTFEYFLSKNWKYSGDIIVEKKNNHFEINGDTYFRFPANLSKLKDFITILISRSENKIESKNEDYSIEEMKSTSNLLLNKNILTGEKYIFISGLGWMIKKNVECLFLLNEGDRFKINIQEQIFQLMANIF